MRAVCFAVVVCAALSVSLAAAAAPSVVTENGRLVLEVPEGTAVEVAYVDENGDRVGSPQMLITKDEVQQMVQQMVAEQAQTTGNDISDATAALRSELMLLMQEQTAIVKDLISRNVSDLQDQVEDNAVTRALEVDRLEGLINGKADASDVLDENDVNVIIGSAVANAGPLKTALAAKLDIDDAFTRDDTIDVVNDLINGAAGDGDDTLRAVLDAINERLESLEAVTGETCGRHCRAGEYVKTPCTGADSPTVCDTCPAQTYSLGGLPNACTDCSTCSAGEFVSAACTSSTDTTCTECKTCAANQWVKEPCGETSDTVCEACNPCNAANRYTRTACTATANAVCGICSTCADDEDVAVPCGATTDTVCVKKSFGFRAVMTRTVSYTSTGTQRLVGDNLWTTTSSAFPSVFAIGDFFSKGAFTAPIDGYYFVSAQTRFDSIAGGPIRLIAGKAPGANELHSIRGSLSHNYISLSVSGVIHMTRGEVLSLYIVSGTDASYSLQSESGFNVFRLPATEGMYARAANPVSLSGVRWNTMNQYVTDGAAASFALPSSSVTNGREYTVQSTGIYLVSAMQRMDSVNARYMRLIITLDGSTNVDGLHSIEGSPPSNYFSMHVTGLLRANAGQKISVAVDSQDSGGWVASTESSFSVMRLNTNLAFAADMSSTASFSTTSKVRVPGWRTAGSPGLFDSSGGAFNPAAGIFTAPRDGIYYAACNIRVDGSEGNYARILLDVSRDGGAAHSNGLHMIRSSQPPYFSASPSGVMRLKTGDQISVQTESYGDANYAAQHESGFFVALLQAE